MLQSDVLGKNETHPVGVHTGAAYISNDHADLSFTLDLHGHTISSDAEAQVGLLIQTGEQAGTREITIQNGTIRATGEDAAGLEIADQNAATNTSVILNNVTIQAEQDAGVQCFSSALHVDSSKIQGMSDAIYAEDAAEREARESARTYAAYHVTEYGQEWYFKTSPGEELLVACKKLRSYVAAEKGTAPDLFIKMFTNGRLITAEEYNALTAVRMENTGKVRGVFDVNFDKREFSAVHIMDGWRTWAMRDVSPSVYHATRSHFASADEQLSKLLELLDGMEITSAGHLSARNFSFSDEIMTFMPRRPRGSSANRSIR